jgi:cobalt-zinc-cadmium efflux system membrane fusion protein
MKAIWIITAALLIAVGSLHAQERHVADEHVDDNPLVVDRAAREQLGIETAMVESRMLGDELHAPAEVKANAYGAALVSPRVPAQVVRRHAKLGDQVVAGQTLVTLSSIEVAEAQGALIVSEREWQRVQALGRDAVSAKRHTEAQVARDQARAKLHAYGVGDGEIAALLRRGSSRATGEFSLAAPQAGRVTGDEFVVGERIEPGRALFTLNDERTVWIEAQLAPDVAARVRSGASARVIAHEQALGGRVVQLAHRSGEGSRTTSVRIEVDNRADLLHAGEFVEVYIASGGTTPALVVPSDAITQLQGEPCVFKADTEDRFTVVPVGVGETRGDFTIIKQGVAAGDTIVVKGVYALKARLLKSQLGEGHAH